jgi:hypothetical protein
VLEDNPLTAADLQMRMIKLPAGRVPTQDQFVLTERHEVKAVGFNGINRPAASTGTSKNAPCVQARGVFVELSARLIVSAKGNPVAVKMPRRSRRLSLVPGVAQLGATLRRCPARCGLRTRPGPWQLAATATCWPNTP